MDMFDILAVAGASVIASFTDWVFMDVLVRARYAAEPGIWRAGLSETGRIVWSQLLGLLGSGVIVFLWVSLHEPGLAGALTLAVTVWLGGVAPIMLQNVIWMRLHPAIGASHAAGWLVRFIITAQLAVWLVPRA